MVGTSYPISYLKVLAEADQHGHLGLVTRGKSAAIYSWMRRDHPPDEWPGAADWARPYGPLWLVDVIGRPGSSGIEIGKALRETLQGAGTVRFWRHRTERFGHFIA